MIVNLLAHKKESFSVEDLCASKGYDIDKLRLNIGAGTEKYSNCISLELAEGLEADVCGDVTKGLQFNNETFVEVLMMHVIEHINRNLHMNVFNEIWRVLKPNGRMIIAFPDAIKAMQGFIDNKYGARWKAYNMIIFGAHRRPGDSHVTAVERNEITDKIASSGFIDIKYQQKGINCIMTARKGEIPNEYF
jgi:predicted SAM-dependent methyltransferase